MKRMERQMRMKGKMMNRTLSARKPLKYLRQQQPRMRKQLEGADEKGDTLIIQVEPIKPLLKLNHKSIATYRPK